MAAASLSLSPEKTVLALNNFKGLVLTRNTEGIKAFYETYIISLGDYFQRNKEGIIHEIIWEILTNPDVDDTTGILCTLLNASEDHGCVPPLLRIAATAKAIAELRFQEIEPQLQIIRDNWVTLTPPPQPSAPHDESKEEAAATSAATPFEECIAALATELPKLLGSKEAAPSKIDGYAVILDNACSISLRKGSTDAYYNFLRLKHFIRDKMPPF